MKLRRAASAAAFLAAAVLYAATPGFEFTGVLTADGKTRIAITDRANNSTTWHEPGDNIDGYVVDRYDAKADAIFLKKSGEEIRLGLVPAKTAESTAAQASAPVLSGTPRPASPTPAAPATTASATTASTSTPSTTASTTGSTAFPAAPGTAPAAATTPAPNAASAAAAAATPVPSPLPASPDTPASPAPNSTAATAPDPAAVATNAPPAEAPLPPTGRQSATPTHTIQGGDTLDSIALTHGVTVQQIRRLNPALNTSTSLRSGDTIRIR